MSLKVDARWTALRERFARTFPESRGPLWLSSAAGRINLIGEHTDYSEGLALPAATNRRIEGVFEAVGAQDPEAGRVLVHSGQFPHPVSFSLDAIPELGPDDWGRFVASSARVLKAHAAQTGRELLGMRGVIESDIPAGSGLSSSAALELLILNTLQSMAGLGLSATTLAQLGQKAEWGAGLKCGILDQLAIVHGKKDQVSLVDARTLEVQPARIDLGDHVFVIGFTRERTLQGSEYETRRREVEAAAEAFRKLTGDARIKTLRDVTPALFEAHRERLGARDVNPGGLPLEARARHVVYENPRVVASVEALGRGGVERFKQLMTETHLSLSQDFQVSSRELDAMVEAAQEYGARFGVTIGARMMGGGFGGPALMLVPTAHLAPFKTWTAERYAQKTGSPGRFWDVTLEEGLFLRAPTQ